MKLIQRAKAYAFKMHGNQYRPNNTKEPMLVHLAEVASYVADECFEEAVIVSAWLHDVVEDTPATLADIELLFGLEVKKIVDALSDPEGWEELPLDVRKPMQAQRIEKQNNDVKLIKLADQTSNIRSVFLDPPSDWSAKKSLLYIEGAKEVGLSCFAASARLEALLERYVVAAHNI